jgi:hypothetical protein
LERHLLSKAFAEADMECLAASASQALVSLELRSSIWDSEGEPYGDGIDVPYERIR